MASGGRLAPDCCLHLGQGPAFCRRERLIDRIGRFFASIAAVQHRLVDTRTVDGAFVWHGFIVCTRHDRSMLAVPFTHVPRRSGPKTGRALIFADTMARFTVQRPEHR